MSTSNIIEGFLLLGLAILAVIVIAILLISGLVGVIVGVIYGLAPGILAFFGTIPILALFLYFILLKEN